LKVAGHADGYDGLEIKWIPQHLPEFFMYGLDGEVDLTTKEDLALLNPDGRKGDVDVDMAKMHAFFQEKGFLRKAGVEIPIPVQGWTPKDLLAQEHADMRELVAEAERLAGQAQLDATAARPKPKLPEGWGEL
jgi:hypothetical protein